MVGLLILFGVAAGLVLAVDTAHCLHRLYHPARRTLGYALARKLPADPGELGLEFVERTFKLADGAATPGWIIRGKNPRGPCVVISHGWSDSRYDCLLRLGRVPELCATLVLYDLRGHGDSATAVSGLGVTEPDDLLAIVDQLEPALGPVVLWGFSFGAGVSIAAAGKEESRTERVESREGGDAGGGRGEVGSKSENGEEPSPRPSPSEGRGGGGGGGRIVGVMADGAFRFQMEPIRQMLADAGQPRVPIAWLIDAHLRFWAAKPGRYDRALLAARMRCPLLLLHGAADRLCPLPGVQAIAAAAKDAKLVVFDGAGHCEMAGRDPARYFEEVAAFVRRLGG